MRLYPRIPPALAVGVCQCNCDDYTMSKFVEYFDQMYHEFGLRGLIATGLGGRKYTRYGDVVRYDRLDGDGDFRSDECVELLKHADIVVTNPPFSLFREYMAQLMEYGKKFLIIGNNNAISYKDIFPYFMSVKLWLGYHNNKTMKFIMRNNYEKYDYIDGHGCKVGKVPSVSWFTNLAKVDNFKPITLTKKYDPEAYPKYDNYDAINVDKVKDIPYDYDGAMGVPITIIERLGLDGLIHLGDEMYKILNCNDIRNNNNVPIKQHGIINNKWSSIMGKAVYDRVIIIREKLAR